MGIGAKGTGQICETCQSQQATRALYFGPRLVVIVCQRCANLYCIRAIDPNRGVPIKETGSIPKVIRGLA